MQDPDLDGAGGLRDGGRGGALHGADGGNGGRRGPQACEAPTRDASTRFAGAWWDWVGSGSCCLSLLVVCVDVPIGG